MTTTQRYMVGRSRSTDRVKSAHALLLEITNLIASSHLNVRQIATKSGVNPNTIGKWIAREVNAPRIDTLTAVARALGYDVTITQRKLH